MQRRRSPSSITLVLIGTAALYGCGEETAQRDIYRSQLDCQQDWGGDQGKCETVRSGPHAGYFYGPRYRADGQHAAGATTLPRQGSSAIGTAHLARNDTSYAASPATSSQRPATSSHGSSGGQAPRGGFGSSATSHSSGG